MKKFYIYLLMMVAAVVVGCTKDLTSDEEINIDKVKTEFMQVEAALEAPAEARTTLTDDGSGKVLWSEGDTIGAVSADGTVTECAIENINGATALFSVPTDTKYAIYPYSSSTTYNAENGTLSHKLASAISLDGTKRVFDDKENVMVAELSGARLSFYHLCGFIEVKLSGSQTVTGVTLRNSVTPWSPISGLGVIDLSDVTNPKFTGDANHGNGFHWVNASCENIALSQAEPTSFYFVVPAGEYKQLAITVKTTTGSYSVQSGNLITVNRAKIRPLATINVDQLALNSVTDLSEAGVANCYIVEQGSTAKNYSFTARKINATENIADVAYAHLTWAESKELISNVNYDATTGKVSFTYKGGNAEGNASIAVFDASNAQLWAWHIWCSDKPELLKVRKVGATQVYGILDRNLGATYVPKTVSEATGISESDANESMGLYYQYGRPTPFPRSRSIKTYNETSFAATTTRCDVMYGFRTYNQNFRATSSKQAYETALQYPNLFYNMYYTDKTGATASTTATSYHTWYDRSPAYNAYADKEYLWYSANTNVVDKKSDNDPCPAGYVVDEGIAGLGYINTTYNRVSYGTGNAESYGYYYNCPVTNAVVWFASGGYRNTGGQFNYVGRNFNLWLVPTYANNGVLVAYRFYPGDTNATTKLIYSNYSQLSFGFNIRCRVMDRTELQNLVFGAAFDEGDGTASSPYILKNSSDVVKFSGLINGTLVNDDESQTTDYSKAYYALGATIDMSGVAVDAVSNFSGSLDGKGYSISNLTLTAGSDAPIGLFARTDGATIKNLTLSNVAITSAYMLSAGLVGEATNTTVENCSVSGNITSTASATYKPGNGLSNGASGVVAGVVAAAFDSIISNVTFSGNVSGKGQFVAGVVAHADGGKIENAKALDGQIYGQSNHVGGIVARVCDDTEITGCVVESQILGKTGVVGGIAARVYGGTIKKSLVSSKASVVSHYLNSTATSHFGTGGIVGLVDTNASYGSKVLIDGCANYAPITGNFYCGGVVGLMKCSVATVPVEVTNSLFFGSMKVVYKASGHAFSGGIVGTVNVSGSTSYATPKFVNCASVISELEYNSTSTGPCIGGVVGYAQYNCSIANCYSNLEGSDIVDASANPITSTSLTRYGAIYGFSYGAANGVSYTDCYYSSAVKVGCDASTSDVVDVSKCHSVTAQEITDGTLLGQLNTTASTLESAVTWVAGTEGYPIPSGLPANTGYTTTSAKTRVSVIGDSISTFETHIPSGYTTYYPKSTVTSAGQTYWYKLIYNYMRNAKLDMNIAWSGTLVTRCTNTSYESQHWYGHDFVARFIDKGMGNPDVILIHGGTNDCSGRGEVSLYPNYAIAGADCPTDEEMATVFSAADAATTREELEALPDDYFVHAYVKLLSLMHQQYPNAKVVMLIGNKIKTGAKAALEKIAAHYETLYGYKCVDLNETTFSGIDGTHPDEVGHENIANLVYTKVSTYIE